VSWLLQEFEYASRAAVDSEGQVVQGTTREYRFSRPRLTLSARAGEDWTVRGGLVGGDRRDTYAGYYDSGSWAAYVSAHRAGPRSGIRLYLSHGSTGYDHATVGSEPGSPTLRGDDVELAGRFDRGISRRVRWFVEGGAQRSDSRDPVFSYDRNWMLAGIHYEH
jgi:hypothetical protein